MKRSSVALRSSRSTALVFGGQGSHKKGMLTPILEGQGFNTPILRTWLRVKDRLQSAYKFDLGAVVRDDPTSMECCLPSEAFKLGVGDDNTTSPVRIDHKSGVLMRSCFAQPAILTTQMLALRHLLNSNDIEYDAFLRDSVSLVAGHSLGEFTALCALGVFDEVTAAELVFARGVIMEQCCGFLASSSSAVFHWSKSMDSNKSAMCNVSPSMASDEAAGPSTAAAAAAAAVTTVADYRMYAVSPKRCMLSEDELTVVIELIAQRSRFSSSTSSSTSSLAHRQLYSGTLLEIVNYNLENEQYVVAGDPWSLSALGKCLDPQFRAAVGERNIEGFEALVREACDDVEVDTAESALSFRANEPLPEPEVPGSRHRVRKNEVYHRPSLSPDGGHTPPETRLSISKEGDGRSGLKKRSWFVPLQVTIPFHSSVLRRGMDAFHDVLDQALPSGELIAAKLRLLPTPIGAEAPTQEEQRHNLLRFFTNITGSCFAPTPQYATELLESIDSQNIGEVTHDGKFVPLITDSLIETCKRCGAGTRGEKPKQGISSSTSPDSVVRDLLKAALCAQFAHSVQWVDIAESILGASPEHVLEISPVPTLTPLFKKKNAATEAAKSAQAGDEGNEIIFTCNEFPRQW